MGVQGLDNQLELIYNSSALTQDLTWMTCRKRWMIERNTERGSGKSVQAARHDDDDDNAEDKANMKIIYMKIYS